MFDRGCFITRSSGRDVSRTRLSAVLCLFAAAIAIGSAHAQKPVGRESEAPRAPRSITATRVGNGPIVSQQTPGLAGDLGDNIDGPSVIKVPGWLKNPLGKYYMYFAHHRGAYIRLAYADRPEGPWTVYGPGTLKLSDTPALHHIASPDVMVDDANKRLLLYYHGPTEMPGKGGGRPYRQRTFVATSTDGISFKAASRDFAPPYMKTFSYNGATYGLAMADKESTYPIWLRSGRFFRSATGLPPFVAGPRAFDEMRHAAVLRRGTLLHIFYTVVGDVPERIYHTQVDLRPDWMEWTATPPLTVLSPERDYEGGNLPLRASKGGMSTDPERALRDPAVLDDDGQIYLYYTVAGEKGIAVAKVSFNMDDPPQ